MPVEADRKGAFADNVSANKYLERTPTSRGELHHLGSRHDESRRTEWQEQIDEVDIHGNRVSCRKHGSHSHWLKPNRLGHVGGDASDGRAGIYQGGESDNLG